MRSAPFVHRIQRRLPKAITCSANCEIRVKEYQAIQKMPAQISLLKQMRMLRSAIPGIQPTMSIVARQIACPLLFFGACLVIVRPCAGGSPIVFEETGSLRSHASITRQHCSPMARCSSTPTPTPTPGSITLSATKRKVAGINTARLTRSGATSTNIDVYRNGMLIVTTANGGSYTDSTGDTGGAPAPRPAPMT